MTEIPVSLEKSPPPLTGYERMVKRTREAEMQKPENVNLNNWFETQESALPEMKVEEADAADGVNWEAAVGVGYDRAGKPTPIVHELSSGFGTIKGIRVTNGARSWVQPIFQNAKEPIDITNPEGVTETVETTGFLGAITRIDETGKKNMLVYVGQEPTVNSPSKATTKTLIQASVGKLNKMKENKDVDPDLDAVNPILTRMLGGDLKSLIMSGSIFVSPPTGSDHNRQEQQNLEFEIPVEDEAIQQELTQDGKYRWITKDEAAALKRAVILNDHAISLATRYLGHLDQQ